MFHLLPPPPMATTDSSSVCLMTTMDRLWFHHIILPQTDPLPNSPLLGPLLQLQEQETSSDSLPQLPQTQSSSVSLPTTTPHQDMEQNSGRPTRLSLEARRPRSHSTSPSSTQRRRRLLKNIKYSSSRTQSGTKLEKSVSSKTWGELELEEVKGFMDLGFVFDKEDISSRMVSLVPGLQRMASNKNKLQDCDDEDSETEEQDCDENDEDDEDVKTRGVMRPYLSEAWLIKRPDSPLLNLRVPRMSASSDDVMKKHLRFWAKTVAFVLQQEC